MFIFCTQNVDKSFKTCNFGANEVTLMNLLTLSGPEEALSSHNRSLFKVLVQLNMPDSTTHFGFHE